MFEDAEFLLSLKRHRNANPGKSPCMIIQEFLEYHPGFSDNFSRYDLESLVYLLEDTVTSSFDPPRYGKASAFVRMDMWFDGLHIMVIGSDDMLAFSRSVDWVLFDGTFKCVPKPFYQLVTVLGCSIQTRKFVPIVHFLLPSKTQATYRAMFEILDTQSSSSLWLPISFTLRAPLRLPIALMAYLMVIISGKVFLWLRMIFS